MKFTYPASMARIVPQELKLSTTKVTPIHSYGNFASHEVTLRNFGRVLVLLKDFQFYTLGVPPKFMVGELRAPKVGTNSLLTHQMRGRGRKMRVLISLPL